MKGFIVYTIKNRSDSFLELNTFTGQTKIVFQLLFFIFCQLQQSNFMVNGILQTSADIVIGGLTSL